MIAPRRISRCGLPASTSTGRRKNERVAHAAFSAVLGPARRATTSADGPIILGRPSSRTSRRSAASRTPRRWAMTMTRRAALARALAIARDQRSFARLVEEGVGLVEHQQPSARRKARGPAQSAATGRRTGPRPSARAACHSPAEAAGSARGRRLRCAAATTASSISRASSASRGCGEARDIFLDRAFEQRRLLRHVAEMRAKLVLVPVGQAGAVDPDRADGRLKRADEDLAERRLARSARADDAEDLAGLGAEADARPGSAARRGRERRLPRPRAGPWAREARCRCALLADLSRARRVSRCRRRARRRATTRRR